jgi:hypothetical protein
MGVAVAGAERVPTRPVARRLALVAIPLCLFALTFFYRFAAWVARLAASRTMSS